MRKIFNYILTFILMFTVSISFVKAKYNLEIINISLNSNDESVVVIPKEKPKDITIQSVVEKISLNLKRIYIEQFGELAATKTSDFYAEYKYNMLTITQNIDSKLETLRTLTVNDGVISHDYIYDLENEEGNEKIVNMLIYKAIFMTVGEIYGYNEEELNVLYSKLGEATFDLNGYEFIHTKEQAKFKLDINRFNIKREVSNKPQENPVPDNNQNIENNNSNSGTVMAIMIIIIIVSLCLLFYVNRDSIGIILRNKFRK